MEETEQQIESHAHNQHDQVAAIDRWLFVKQEEHDAISLAEAYFLIYVLKCSANLTYCIRPLFQTSCDETFCSKKNLKKPLGGSSGKCIHCVH